MLIVTFSYTAVTVMSQSLVAIANLVIVELEPATFWSLTQYLNHHFKQLYQNHGDR